jgi:hypothetical protein
MLNNKSQVTSHRQPIKDGPPSRSLGVWPITLHSKHVLVHFQKGFGIKRILRNDAGGTRSG